MENLSKSLEEKVENIAENETESKSSGFFSSIMTEIKNKSKKGIALLTAMIVVGILLGFAAGYGITTGFFEVLRGQEKEFSISDFSITLNESFEQYNLPHYSVVYASDEVTVYVNKTTSVAVNAEALARSIVLYNSLSCNVVSEDGLTYFIYSKPKDDGKTYSNYTYVYKNNEDFWIVEFSVEERLADRYDDDIKEWARSVELN